MAVNNKIIIAVSTLTPMSCNGWIAPIKGIYILKASV